MENYRKPRWSKLFPENEVASFWLNSGISAILGLFTVVFAVYVAREYGIALFCGTPIVLGFLAPFFHGIGAPRKFWSLLAVSIFSQICMFGGMLIFGLEGIFCVIMAAPLWMTWALIGACIAWPIHRAMWRPHMLSRGFPVICLLMVAALPLWMGAERIEDPQSPVMIVSSTADIDAPADVVWRHLVEFPDLPPMGWSNGGWLFKAGIARPVRSEMVGSGIGATRYCVFSTGRAGETVQAWEPGRLLEITVNTTPAPMEETSIYPNLNPPHLEGYFHSRKARFELVDLGHGRTRVIGTSWYQNQLFPVAYWSIWSDAAVKAVQVNVLAHIKALSEAEYQTSAKEPEDAN